MLPFLQEINWYARQVIREDSMLALPMLRSLMPWDELIASAGWFGLLTHNMALITRPEVVGCS